MINALKTVRGAFHCAALAAAVSLAATPVCAQEKALAEVTYLFPAPANAIAFAPFMLAQHKGYYKQAGLEPKFVSVKGGADVGKQLGAGNGQLGGALGDTPLILRNNGIPVKGVALLGGQALHQLMTRADRNIKTPADLKSRTLTVVAYQDTSFYAALSVIGQAKLTKDDVNIQAAGPTGIWQQVALGKADGMIGAPEMGAFAEEEGTPLKWESTGTYFPGMAQAILASDDMIAKNPDLIRKFVAATLKAVAEVRDDPATAAKEYVEAVPSYKGREAMVQKVLSYYAKNVYPGQARLGQFSADRVKALQDFYLTQGIIQKREPTEALFTNQFVQ